MELKEYKEKKALEEVVRKIVEKVKESNLDYPLFHGGLYKRK